MSVNKRHLRTMPDGSLAITTLICEDNDPREVDLCRRTQFELGRQYLAEPSGVDAFRSITELGEDWRSLVHFTEWVRWRESLPLEACHCVDVSELPGDRTNRNNWMLQGQTVVITED